jgi:hypothetical protein
VNNKLLLDGDTYSNLEKILPSSNYQHLYVTCEEEIKEGDWFYCFQNNNVLKCFKKEEKVLNGYHTVYKKIILTTDTDLIKDGVQKIDDEFLEWFVKNPSCEEVEVEFIEDNWGYYEIIIPKKEPKQETLEEAAEKYVKSDLKKTPLYGMFNDTFIAGAKWQAERMYSEEEVHNILKSYRNNKPKLYLKVFYDKWFEQFKNK